MTDGIIKKYDKKYIANTYGRFDVVIEKAKSGRLYSKTKEYIDFGAGIAVNIFGAGDEAWQKAVIRQVRKLAHTSNLYYTEPDVKLAKALCTRTGMKKVFFCNSGAEANECAIKVARKYSSDKYGGERYRIVSLVNSFHGRTIATLSATGQQCFHTDFNPFLEGFDFAKANDIEDIKSKISDKTAAVMLEMIQGEGGVMPLEKEFVSKVAELCLSKDILLIIDEVQTGNGRTGTLYAYEQYGLQPDIVTTAKGLAGGLPFGVAMLGKKCENTLTAGTHGSTFGGNPLCSAAALSVLSRIDESLLVGVKERGEYITKALLGMKNVKKVDGMGLMLGVTIEGNAKEVANACLASGLMVLTAKDKVRLLPPLNISYEDIDKGLAILAEALGNLSAK